MYFIIKFSNAGNPSQDTIDEKGQEKQISKCSFCKDREEERLQHVQSLLKTSEKGKKILKCLNVMNKIVIEY